MKKTAILITAETVLLIALDQGTKWLADLYLRDPYAITSWFQLKYGQNTGIAWSIQMPFPLLIILNVVIIAFFFYFAVRRLNLEKTGTQAVVALITAGAFSNIIDRLKSGFVIDFISVGFWPVFNLADAFLSIGIFLILLFYAKIKRT